MELNSLTAISPIDGRYRNQCSILDDYFSEYALIKYRVFVEVEYFIALCQLPLPQLKKVDKKLFISLRKLYTQSSISDAQEIKSIEKITNHDVKAVEYFLKKHFEKLGMEAFSEFVHFGLTSQDINNTAIPYSLKEALNNVIIPLYDKLCLKLDQLSDEWMDIPMLARTHGQPASPTILGKEFLVFSERLKKQLELFIQIPLSAKFGGATGNFNAHYVAYPKIDWVKFSTTFVNKTLGLSRSHVTTQIEHYDNMAALCDSFKRLNTIIIDMDRDIWNYISMDYFKQKTKKEEVGSSAMPHKVNPIDFENSEGNLGMANAIFEHLAAKLPISRLQRDLTDSTVLRNIGVPFSHTVIAINSTIKGLDKLILNADKIKKDLSENWAVVAEAIQTILRREAYPKPYEALKELTRGNKNLDETAIKNFIKTLKISKEVKAELNKISPFNYTGIKPEMK